VIKELEIGVVYALWSGVGIALTALAGVVFYDERMDFPKVCGLLAIAFGAVLLQLSSK
jgi:small multidrug resistance pump